jgi:hypothetical protein
VGPFKNVCDLSEAELDHLISAEKHAETAFNRFALGKDFFKIRRAADDLLIEKYRARRIFGIQTFARKFGYEGFRSTKTLQVICPVEPAFLAMAIASGLHAVEEYLYPGGFLRWLRFVFPRTAPGLVGAMIINAAFFCLVLSPLFSDAQRPPTFSLSIASLLLANGALHVIVRF